MRRNRWIAAGLFFLSLIAISFYGGPVSYGFFFLMLIIPIVSALYTVIVFFRFKIYQKIDAKVTVAEKPVRFYFTLQNEDFFTFSGIKTDFFSDYSALSGLDPDTEFELFPHTGIKKNTRLVCKYRGEYEVGVKNVTVQDYLKLFSFTFRNRETITVTVVPQLVILDELPSFDALAVSDKQTAAATEPDVPVREYIPGDDIRRINWKLTAATGKPMVRGRTGESMPSVGIIMDSHRISRNPSEFLPLENKLLETSLALAYYYVMRGIRVYFYAYSMAPFCHTIESTDAFEEFYNRISSFAFYEDSTSEKLFGFTEKDPELVNAGAVIFVIHKPDDPYVRQVSELKKNSVSVATCLVTDEEVTDPEAIVIGYDDKLKEKLQAQGKGGIV